MTGSGDAVITNVRLVEGAGLGAPCTVTVRAGVVSDIAADDFHGAQLYDGAGRTLVPGLIDCHVHVTSPGDLDALAAYGVSTALDMATHSVAALVGLAASRGATDVRTAGPPASAPGGLHTTRMGFPAESAVANPDHAREFVSRRVADGASYVKLIVDAPRPSGGPPVLDAPTMHAVVQASREAGLLSVAHATTVGAVRRALAAGVDVLTHVPLEAPLPADVVDEIASRGTVVVPTLVMMQAVAALPTDSPAYRPGMDLSNAQASVSALHRAGVVIAAGTDANTAPGTVARVAPGASLHAELALLVSCGLTPYEALAAASTVAASAFGLADRGAVSVGLRADLLLVDGDPTADVSALQHIAASWRTGVMVPAVPVNS